MNSDSLSSATIFDLASLTKPIATTTMAAILYERGLLELDAPVIGIVSGIPLRHPILAATKSPSACCWPTPPACPRTKSCS